MSNDKKTPPLVLFVLDGADAGFVERWTSEGSLPTISSIMERGFHGRIGGPELMSTQGAWRSLFSGKPRSEHGHYYYQQLVPGTYTIKNGHEDDTHARPFWYRLQERSKRVAIVDAFEASLVRGLPGVQLTNWGFQQQFGQPIEPPLSEPGSFVNEAICLIGAPIHIQVFKPGSTYSEDVDAYHMILKRVETKGALCRHVLAQARYDLMVFSFFEAHTVGHRLWDYRPGGSRYGEVRGEATDLSTAIRDVYQAIDRELGLLLKQLPEETNVFVLSLFGMKDLYPTYGLIEAFCRRLGYQVPAHGPAKSQGLLPWIRRTIRPDVRVQLSRFLPQVVRSHLGADRFHEGTDWTKTRAFPLPSLQVSFIRVNLRGREPQGIINPGPEYEELLNQIEADLKDLVDVQSGKPAVNRVIRTADAFGCGPPSALPDLVVEWRSSSYFMDRITHPKTELVQGQHYYHRSSHHTMEGFVVGAGPSIPAKDDLGEFSPLEFAPAFLALLDEPIDHTKSNHLLFRMFPRSFEATDRVRSES